MLGFLVGLSDRLYLALNGLAGHSWVLDQLMALPVDNNLVKAGPVGACFVYAWYSGRAEAETRRRRSILIVTAASLFFVLLTTKTMGDSIFLPRPFVQSQQMWHLEEGRLVESPKLAYREPLAGQNRDRFEALERGDVVANDLVSFPSDHAGFFFALSLGIAFASRRAGLVALGWSVFILLSRIVTGMHSPLDILAGAMIGAAILLLLQFIARRWGGWALDPITGWTFRHEALAAALLFLAAFELTNLLDNARYLAGSASDIVDHLRGA